MKKENSFTLGSDKIRRRLSGQQSKSQVFSDSLNDLQEPESGKASGRNVHQDPKDPKDEGVDDKQPHTPTAVPGKNASNAEAEGKSSLNPGHIKATVPAQGLGGGY